MTDYKKLGREFAREFCDEQNKSSAVADLYRNVTNEELEA